ncbi:MAG: hypothetical protein HKO65_09445 [Gemmatimonadetes bacterium]|nr:hypothetical protein [Gemmatimonadota bacterium]
MRTFHHIGIPTSEPRPGEVHLPEFGMYVSGFGESPYGVEWMRFDPASPIPKLIQQVPHIAFEVDDLDGELKGQEVIVPPNSPSPGVRVAFIVHNGAPIEFLEVTSDE